MLLFPDLGCYEEWHKKTTTLNQAGYKVVVSDLLEAHTSKADQQEGFDLADYFIQRDKGFGWALRDGYPLFWD